jgi:selenium-binding protein 1
MRKSLLGTGVVAFCIWSLAVHGDETCLSPFMAKITGQEQFVYIWTLGMEGVGDESDKLVTVDVDPNSSTYGTVVHTVSVGGRHEAHHMDFTDDRFFLWAAGLDTNQIFIFDVHTDPGKPRIVKTITDFRKATGGLVGPHTPYALPGRMLVTALSNDQDFGGRTGIAEYTNDGKYVATHWNPVDGNLRGAVKSGQFADGFGYDVKAVPHKNVLISSSFTGWNNYMMDLGKLLEDENAMKQFGNTVVIWNLHTRQPKKILDVPGAPLELRCSWGPGTYCFTTTALTARIWLIYEDEQGEWQAKAVGTVGNPDEVPLPVDIKLTSDSRILWVNTFNEGMSRAYDVSDPFNPKEIYAHKHGKDGDQINMHSLSWDGTRVYVTTSLLSMWDKRNAGQYLKGYGWDGKQLSHRFTVDFIKEGLGRPHQPRFGARQLYDVAASKDQRDGTSGKETAVAARPSASVAALAQGGGSPEPQ